MANVGDQIGASAKDAWSAVTSLIVNPVGGLAAAYSSLGPARAMSAGIAMAAAFATLAALGVANNPLMSLGLFIGAGGLGFGFDPSFFGIFIKALVAFLLLAGAMAGASFAVRKVASGQGPIAVDLFTAGAALTPMGIAMLLSGFMGEGSTDVALILILFAMTYLVLMLYAGLTRIGGVSEKAAAPAVPIIFILSQWVCRLVLNAMAGGPRGFDQL